MIDNIEKSDLRKPLLLVVSAAILSGFSGILIRYMSIPPTSMAAVRTGIPVLIMGIVLIYQGNPIFKSGYKWMLGASAINVLRMYTFFLAYIYTSIPNAIIVLYTWPIFATILSVIFLKERISNRQIGLLVLSFIGILIVYADQTISIENRDFIGLSAGVICAFSYASTIIIFKSQTSDYKPTEMIFFQNLLPAIIFIPFLFFNTPAPTILDWELSITHGILIGVIMFFMFFHGLRQLPASLTSMVTYVEVVAAMLLGYFILDEALSGSAIIGGGLIILSTVLLRLPEKKT